jgi:hypothetical protein
MKLIKAISNRNNEILEKLAIILFPLFEEGNESVNNTDGDFKPLLTKYSSLERKYD